MQGIAQRVHAGYAHTVQTAGYLVGVFIEFTTCVQNGHHHFEGGTLLFLVHARGDATAVILHADGVVFTNSYINVLAIPGQGFVDGVVYHLINQVV